MTPNSVNELAPSNVYIPPATHKRIIANGDGNCSATRPGVRRIPTPIVAPTLTARPKPRPRTRRSWPDVSETMRVRTITHSDLETSYGEKKRLKSWSDASRMPCHLHASQKTQNSRHMKFQFLFL